MALDIGPELIAKRTGCNGEGYLHCHRFAVDLDSPHHSELDDVGAELRVYDASKRHSDGRHGGCTCAGGSGGRDRWVMRRAHGMIEPTGAMPGSLPGVAPKALTLKALMGRRTAVSLATSTVKLGQRPSPVTLTDAAVAKVTDLLAQEGDEGLALRVAVRPGGCSGYSYEMFFDSELADDDVVRSFGPVRVVVDPESADLIKGATLDYRDGLQEAGFHITNPNATRTCGCGSSFS